MPTLTIDVPLEVQRRLEKEAARRNMAVPDVARLLLQALQAHEIGPLPIGFQEAAVSEEDRLCAIDAAYGALVGLRYSVDQFLSEKSEETEREEARHGESPGR